MKTTIANTPRLEHKALCALVLAQLEHIKWRHSGLGMLQGYVLEGTDREIRVHIWHPSLRRPGIEESGLLHDHRFDLTSHVLVGGIRQTEYQLAPNSYGRYMLYSVLHARAAHTESGGQLYHQEPQKLEGLYEAEVRSVDITAGCSYFFPAREFHGTDFYGSLCVTLVTKTNQTEEPAKLLAPRDRPLVHAFSDPLPEKAWFVPLYEAQQALRAEWLKT
jgi:hypothetical protein